MTVNPRIVVGKHTAELTPHGWDTDDPRFLSILRLDELENPFISWTPLWQEEKAREVANRLGGTLLPPPTLKEALAGALKGGPGSGNFSHAGRPGHVGGSASQRSGVSSSIEAADVSIPVERWRGEADPIERRLIHDKIIGEVSERNKQLNDFLCEDIDNPGPQHRMEEAKKYSDMFEFVAPSEVPAYFATDETRSQVKAKIVREVSARTALPETTISAVLESWASTSNNSAAAKSLQQAVSEEFGIPLSDYQKEAFEKISLRGDATDRRLFAQVKKELINTYTKDRDFSNKVIRQITDKVTRGELVSSFIKDNQTYWNELNHKANRTDQEIRIDADTEARSRLDGRLPFTDRKNERKILRAMYNWTQDRLSAHGIKELTLYRGLSLPKEALPEGQTAHYRGNAVDSWTSSLGTAGNFSHGGYILAARVPARNVLCTAVTGMGCLKECEFVLMTGKNATVKVVYVNR